MGAVVEDKNGKIIRVFSTDGTRHSIRGVRIVLHSEGFFQQRGIGIHATWASHPVPRVDGRTHDISGVILPGNRGRVRPIRL